MCTSQNWYNGVSIVVCRNATWRITYHCVDWSVFDSSKGFSMATLSDQSVRPLKCACGAFPRQRIIFMCISSDRAWRCHCILLPPYTSSNRFWQADWLVRRDGTQHAEKSWKFISIFLQRWEGSLHWVCVMSWRSLFSHRRCGHWIVWMFCWNVVPYFSSIFFWPCRRPSVASSSSSSVTPEMERLVRSFATIRWYAFCCIEPSNLLWRRWQCNCNHLQNESGFWIWKIPDGITSSLSSTTTRTRTTKTRNVDRYKDRRWQLSVVLLCR